MLTSVPRRRTRGRPSPVRLASRGRKLAAASAVLCLFACVPTAELSSYTDGPLDSSGAGAAAVPDLPSLKPPAPDAAETPALPTFAQASADAGVSVTPASTADAASPSTEPLASPCGDVARLGPNGHCYLVEASPRSWSEARAQCQARGAGWDLASLRSPLDSVFAAELLEIEAWVGATDAAVEGQWLWADTAEAFWSGTGAGQALNGAYTNWNSDEPNGGDNSDCARTLPRSLLFPRRVAPWADLSCAERRGALCEGPRD